MSKAKLLGSSIAALFALLGEGTAQATLVMPALPNPGFEQDNSGSATPTGWTSQGSSNADFTEWGGHGGNWRLSHWSAEPYSVATQQTVGGLKPGWYTL